MADVEYWIQIENHAWDLAPNNIDRMHGQTMEQAGFPAPVVKTLTSPVTGVLRNRDDVQTARRGRAHPPPLHRALGGA